MSRSPTSSYSRSKSRSISRSRSPRGYREDEDNRDTIFAGNLNHETTEEELRGFFSTYGRVLETTASLDYSYFATLCRRLKEFEDFLRVNVQWTEIGTCAEGNNYMCWPLCRSSMTSIQDDQKVLAL